MNFMTTGGVIKHLRKRKGLSQEELGVILGVKRVTVQKYESDSIVLNADIIRKLCRHFYVPAWVLLFPEDGVTEEALDTMAESLSRFYSLNSVGLKKVGDYVYDLSQIEAYRKEP